VHEIKHDGFRMMVRRDAAGVRRTRNGHDWSDRFPLIAEAADALKVRSCLLDGVAVDCDRDGLSTFDRLCYWRQDGAVFLFASTRSRSTARICGGSPSRSASAS
jgi:hypothetical protein